MSYNFNAGPISPETVVAPGETVEYTIVDGDYTAGHVYAVQQSVAGRPYTPAFLIGSNVPAVFAADGSLTVKNSSATRHARFRVVDTTPVAGAGILTTAELVDVF